MKLRVKKHVPIPHVVLIPNQDAAAHERYVSVKFNPDADVPDAWGEARLKDSANVYMKAEGKFNEADYRIRESSQVQSLHEKFDSLTAEERTIHLKLMDKTIADRKAKEAAKQAAEEDAKRKEFAEKAEAEARAKKEGKA